MAYNDYDYVVLIDENGQPYIAHGVFRTVMGKAKQGAKYLLKAIDTRTGLPVYAYTAEEVRRLQGMGREAKKTAGKVANKAEWAARGVGADIRRTTGIGGKKRAEELQARADSTTNRSKSAIERQAANARAEYENSILGRLEKTGEKLKQHGRVARDTIRKYGSMTLAEIRKGAGAVASRAGSLATSAGNAIRTGAGAVVSRAGSIATNVGNAAGSAINTAARYVPGTKQNKANKAVNAAQERGARDTQRGQRQQAQAQYDAAVRELNKLDPSSADYYGAWLDVQNAKKKLDQVNGEHG